MGDVRVHRQLDAIAAKLAGQGLDLDRTFGAGPSRSDVVETLRSLGLQAPEELVEFFSWRSVVTPDGAAGIFWETFYFGLGPMVETYRQNLALAASLGPLTEDQWPGAADRFPVLMVDGSEIVSVQCEGGASGSVWFAFTQDHAFRMFESLSESLDAALYCLEAGHWVWDVDDQAVAADRDWMPWPQDLRAIPWQNPRGSA